MPTVTSTCHSSVLSFSLCQYHSHYGIMLYILNLITLYTDIVQDQHEWFFCISFNSLQNISLFHLMISLLIDLYIFILMKTLSHVYFLFLFLIISLIMSCFRLVFFFQYSYWQIVCLLVFSKNRICCSWLKLYCIFVFISLSYTYTFNVSMFFNF